MPAKKKNDLKDEKATLASIYKDMPKVQPKVEPKAQPKAEPKAAPKAPSKAKVSPEVEALDKQIAELDVQLANARLTVFRRNMAMRQRDALVGIRNAAAAKK